MRHATPRHTASIEYGRVKPALSTLTHDFLSKKTVLLPYISPLFPFLPANALKRHFLFGLHTKYECVYFSFAFTYKIIRTLNITAHHPAPA
ncbi:hypothetical protein FNJ74_22180 [Escherichia coli]|nr:hypothetical protein FNJ74_22180 [Escherichia coli]RRO47100.1 hypothetical protein AWF38_022210 [Escherichia coli]